jgi:hypothetical protein
VKQLHIKELAIGLLDVSLYENFLPTTLPTIIVFFFEQGIGPEGSRAALFGGINYKEDLKNKKKYNTVLHFYRKDLI